jgi:hypothetical protein
MRAKVEIEEIEEGEEDEQIGEAGVLEALDGAFEELLTQQAGESIDELEASLLRLQYVAGREAMARHLTEAAQKKHGPQRSVEAEFSATRRPTESTER